MMMKDHQPEVSIYRLIHILYMLHDKRIYQKLLFLCARARVCVLYSVRLRLIRWIKAYK